MYKEIFTAVCDRLEKEVPALRWIDAEMGQLSSRGDTRPPVAFPCVLVEISYTACDTLSGGRQRVNAEVQLKVGFDIPGPTNSKVPTWWNSSATTASEPTTTLSTKQLNQNNTNYENTRLLPLR